jgi:hypothetical protein
MSNDVAWQALCAFAKNPQRNADPREPWEVVTRPATPKKSRKPTVTLHRAMKQASKAGVAISGATINPDGSATLQFGEPQQQANPWDSVQ